jgi:hypothetical protein
MMHNTNADITAGPWQHDITQKEQNGGYPNIRHTFIRRVQLTDPFIVDLLRPE